VQVCVPVEHDVVPVWQDAGVQERPAVHATHEPLLHTMFVPHAVPSAAFDPVSPHAIPPSPQTIVPRSHGAPEGTQPAPFVQVWHDPLSQYLLAPQAVPLGALPAWVQVAIPVEQEIAYAWHEPASLQSAPALHATHPPLSHTAPASQFVPFVAGTVGVQVGWPEVLHVMTPF
jgi:hypothetical protein